MLNACTKDKLVLEQDNETTFRSNAKKGIDESHKCYTMEVLEENMLEDPDLKQKMKDIEDQTEHYIKAKKNGRLGVDEVLTIPVVVNVLYRNSVENISNAQIQSQIDVLNEAFSATNSELSNYNGLFRPIAADFKIRFTLQNIVRKATTKTSWGTRDAMKNGKKGGISPTNPNTTLNLWSCNIGGGILGYAQFPGGNINTDGVVIDSRYFGLSGLANAPYHLGDTGTHEVGHWLNLRHIWGDANCGSDLVSDTPTHATANYGCIPADSKNGTCVAGSKEMTMNYMDYTDDACMYMFTNGQRLRSRALFEAGAARSTFNP
jgi:hypothetical protein